MNTNTLNSPGIGMLDATKFADLGGCIIDIVGLNTVRVTAQVAAGRMFKGWVAGFVPPGPGLPPGIPPWKVILDFTFDGSAMVAGLGGGIAAANIRITLYDGDSGSPNPVYVAMFGAGHFPYLRASTQPGNYDFDGGNNLGLGFENISGAPVICGYMGGVTTYRLDASSATIDTFTGFPGCFALTDSSFSATPKPPTYMTPVQTGQPAGVWPVTGWFSVPGGSLAALYGAVSAGRIKIGINDPISSGDQYYDFTQGLAADVVNIPFVPPVTPWPPVDLNYWLDLWVWRELHRFESTGQDLNFPPGYAKALLYALALELYPEYPAAAAKYDYAELAAEVEGAIADLERLNESDAVAQEPAI